MVYAPTIAAERASFFRRLAPFLDDSKRPVLMGDWNAILDPKIDKVGWGASRVGRCEISLVGLSCPTFHLIAWTDHKLVRVRLRPSLADYWKFNTSLLKIRDFRDRPESLIKRALVGALTGNRWLVSLKHRIRDFATKYGRQLNLDKTREAKSIEDRLSRVVAGGTP